MSNIKTNHEAQQAMEADEAWSALVDGEAFDHEIDGMLAAFADDAQARARWHRYQVIGDVLRGSAPAVTGVPPEHFLATLRSRLAAEPPQGRPEPVAVNRPVATPVPAELVDRPSANDAIFRWKMVAGLASLAAVMAVSWGITGSLTQPVDGSQLAISAPVATQPKVELVNAPAPQPLVVVPSGQGPVIRDPQLEALMAEHRQHGGMSALQMPAGFLRNATFDAPSR